LKEIREYTKYPEFLPEFAMSKSFACAALLRWVACIEAISNVRFSGRVIKMVDGVIGERNYNTNPPEVFEDPDRAIRQQTHIRYHKRETSGDR